MLFLNLTVSKLHPREQIRHFEVTNRPEARCTTAFEPLNMHMQCFLEFPAFVSSNTSQSLQNMQAYACALCPVPQHFTNTFQHTPFLIPCDIKQTCPVLGLASAAYLSNATAARELNIYDLTVCKPL